MQDVEADVGEGVAEVPGVVRGHAADVEAHPVAAGDRLEGVRGRHVGCRAGGGSSLRILKRVAPEAPIAGWTRPIESARGWGLLLPQSTEAETNMEVLRWLLFFAIAMFLIVAGIFFVLGRDLPIPRF